MRMEPIDIQTFVTLEDCRDRYVVRLVFDEREFDHVMSSAAERSLMLLGFGREGCLRLIDVISFSTPIDPGSAEVVLEGTELVVTLAKSDACALTYSAEVDLNIDFPILPVAQTSDAGRHRAAPEPPWPHPRSQRPVAHQW